MFWFFAIIALVVLFIINNTKRGAEFVRAHIYLSGIEAGFSSEECNAVTMVPISEVPNNVIDSAKVRALREHSGKQLPIIKKAYQAGMICRLPSWQRKLMMIS